MNTLALVLSSLVLSGSAAAASLTAEGRAQLGLSSSRYSIVAPSGPLVESAHYDEEVIGQFADSSIEVDFGRIVAELTVATYYDGRPLTTYANALGAWSDTLLVAGEPGSEARVVFAFDLAVEPLVPGPEPPRAGYQFSFAARNDRCAPEPCTYLARGDWRDREPGFFGAPPGRVYVAALIRLGEAFDIELSFEVGASAASGGDFGAPPSATLAGSLVYAGMRVVDAYGEPIDFDVTADSGFNYGTPIPEPGIGLLALFALGGVLARRAA